MMSSIHQLTSVTIGKASRKYFYTPTYIPKVLGVIVSGVAGYSFAEWLHHHYMEEGNRNHIDAYQYRQKNVRGTTALPRSEDAKSLVSSMASLSSGPIGIASEGNANINDGGSAGVFIARKRTHRVVSASFSQYSSDDSSRSLQRQGTKFW
jgi:hypothetical protein